MAEHGWVGATPDRVAREARVHPPEFYDHFRSLEACYLAVYDRMLGRVSRTALRLVAARTRPPGVDAWQEQLDAIFSGLLLFFSLEPALARTCLVEVLSAGPAARARREAALDDFARYVESLRLSNGEPMPPLAAELIALGTTDLLYRRVARGETEQLPTLLPELRQLWLTTVEQHTDAPVAATT
ncbi:MAG TPA: TetR/AcrR family transcriptional regulator [Solirubrobacteraceae bacterium]|nr:TetR/AcrR family transcriptional regulator [Solirubrobacteraceae bacterium]